MQMAKQKEYTEAHKIQKKADALEKKEMRQFEEDRIKKLGQGESHFIQK